MTPSSPTSQPDDNAVRMDLFAAICDETATALQFEAFENLLRHDEQARDDFSQFVQMQVLLQRKYAVGQFPADIPAPAIMATPPPSSFLAAPLRGAFDYFSQEVPLSYFIGTVLTALLLLIASLVQVSDESVEIAERSPSRPTPIATPRADSIGRITGMFDCRGSRTSEEGREEKIHPLHNVQSSVALGDKFVLSSGLLEITYDSGANVILQGPVTYEVDARDGGFLSLGKLTARLEKKGSGVRGQGPGVRGQGSEAANHKSETINQKSLSPAPMFAVRTPSAVVTDLGTEFGVEVDKAGTTTSHVFRGSVEVQMVTADGTAEGDAQILHENQSARVEKDSGPQNAGNRMTVFVTQVKPADFVREIPRRETPKPTIKTFDLVDVVAGGNGFTGKRNRGIDPTNGRATDMLSEGQMVGDGTYHRVVGMPFVDGVFIPDGRTDQVQIDSAGHTFASFGNASNLTANHIWAGGVIPTTPPNAISTEMGGINYATPGHGLLFLHSNKGITFDLDAIRRNNPDYRLIRFRAVAGNTETISVKGTAVYADLWVLVDGQPRFKRRDISNFLGAMPINVSIGEKDRFLTLAATDGGHTIEYNWILFGDPRLELLAVGSEAGSSHNTTMKGK